MSVITVGLKTVYESPSSPSGSGLAYTVDVVAVHGLGADPDWTWTTNDVNWLSDVKMLPCSIPNSRIMRFGYESAWLGKEAIQQRLPLVADQLLRGLVAARKTCLTRPIVFIGHCFGGLVIQKAILHAKLHEEDYPLIVKSLGGVIFLGTPHKGSQSQSKASLIATIASALQYGEQSSLLRVVEKDSEMLADLLHDFTRIANIQSIPLFCFFEQHKSDIAQVLKPKGSPWFTYMDTIVDERSGCIDGFPKLGLASDHFRLNKFGDPEDGNYRFVRDQVIKLVETAGDRVAQRMHSTQDSPLNTDERNEKCLHALFITDPTDDMETIEHNTDRLLEQTCSWVLKDVHFGKWRTCARSQVLWIYGDPGKGKTMLAISLVKELSERIRLEGSSPNIALACFFCDNKDNRRKSAISILRSLIYQLLRQRPDLCSYLRSEYERQKERLFASPNALQSLWRIFKNVTTYPNFKRIYIVIDGLDECDEQSTEDLLKLLEPFLESGPDTGNYMPDLEQENSCQLKWLFTSRNNDIIKSSLGRTLNISLELNSAHVDNAVGRFIDRRVNQLKKLKRYDAALAMFVEESLREKAEGTFLYVSLACRELSSPTVRTMNTKSVLSRLPRGLTPLYERILEQIATIEDEELAAHAKAILRSMVLAVRPLSLFELAVAAALPKEHRYDTIVLDEYLTLCGSFVSRRRDTVFFVHQSVKTYLLSVESLFPFELEIYHGNLAGNHFDHICKASSYKPEDQHGHLDLSEAYQGPLEYPVSFWMYHARLSGACIIQQLDLNTDFFMRHSRTRQTWLDSYWLLNHLEWERPPANFTALHLAAYGGISALISTLLDRGDELNEVDSGGNDALIWSARNGFDDVVEILLSRGARPHVKNHDGLTALFWAAANGHKQVVQTLIKHGASVHITDKFGWAPLHRAAYYGHRDVLTCLINAGADIEAKDVTRWTALQRATCCGNLPVVNILIDKNACIKLKDKDGLTLLHMAAEHGHLDLVSFWLERVCDIEAVDNQGWTALMYAAWHGHRAPAAYLLRNGAKINSRSLDGNTALHLATWNGHAAVVKLLLENNAAANSSCEKQETPLQQAAWRGHVEVARLLLEAGVDPNARCDSGLTALHQAASNGHEPVARLLLQWGADPELRDSGQQTPRMQAEENNHHSIAKLLKETERDGAGDETLQLPKSSDDTALEALDPAVCELLGVPVDKCSMQPHGRPGFSKPAKVIAIVSGKTRHYFMKSGPIGDMFASEHMSLRALHNVVPSICPHSVGHGKLADSMDSFLLIDFIDIAHCEGSSGSGLSLAQKLAKLHSVPAPVPEGYQQPMFGFPVSTFCGATRQDNSYCASWSKFFTENRLLAIAKTIEEQHGTNKELRAAIDKVASNVVPKLLRNGHLGGRRGITPVLIHGDLWSGNRTRGTIPGWSGPEDVVFDPSSCYAHSEYEIGIMRMFGGFSAGFFHEYHRLVSKTEPKEEYEDRMQLYQLYHYLNHYALFCGGYKDDAMDIMKKLIQRHGERDD